MDLSDITSAEWADLVMYGVLGTYMAWSIPRLFRGSFRAAVGALAFWGALLFAAVGGYAYRTELRAVTDRVMAVLIPGTPIDTDVREVTVFRRTDGQFVVNGNVNGKRASFVLDTGASSVVIRAEDAAKMKIPVRTLNYDVEVSTANGRAMAADITVPKLSVGAIAQENVRALVARPGALHENLLGMTFLNGLASFTVTNDRLVLRGR